jgi:peptidoglycan/LPS O-acetylase OafA/YrhL
MSSAAINIDSRLNEKGGREILPHVDYLDGWRGLAILLVLENHFFPLARFESGPLGVDIFFCLSGLLMSELLYVRRVPLALFYRRRVSRIFPAFFVFVTIIYSWAYLAGIPHSWSEVFYTLTFLRSYLPSVPSLWDVNIPIAHLWSLNVEEHCYVVMSILTLSSVIRGREALALIGIALLTIPIHIVYVAIPQIAPPNYGIHTEIVASHILLSAGYRLLRNRVVQWVQPWMPLASLVLAVGCYVHPVPTWTLSLISPLLLAFTVNHLKEAPMFFRRMLSVRPIRIFGIWSYSLYLWQQPFTNYQERIPGGSAVALIAATIVGLVSFYLFESPVRAWLNARWV